MLEFSGDIRRALEQLIGDSVPENSWNQAQLGIASGGLGLRCVHQHAPAAYLASIISSKSLALTIDPAFDPTDAAGALHVKDAMDLLEHRTLNGATVDMEAEYVKQKSLSKLIDAKLSRWLGGMLKGFQLSLKTDSLAKASFSVRK